MKNNIFIIILFLFFSYQNAQSQNKAYLIGDSTCADYDENRLPLTGWGTKFKDLITGAVVINHARSGRSSKSFYNEPEAWPQTIAQVSSGDFVFIQFGHNDQKTDPERHTIPFTTYQEYLLKYINETRAKNAYPVLVTSIYRNYWTYDNQLYHSLGDYPAAMIELAQEENVPLIDLNELTKLKMEELGRNYCTYNIFMNLFPETHENYPNGLCDDTHLQNIGADIFANLVFSKTNELKSQYSYLSPLFN